MPANLRDLFLHLQGQLEARLQTNRSVIHHAGAKGLASEDGWRAMMADYLPKRYQVSKAFVIDSDGGMSHEIDLVIHDRQYSPFLFNQNGTCYIPAESVYAVFEVKQDLAKENVGYAIEKAESVRRLKRTSVAVTHVQGTTKPDRPPFPILSGLLCLESGWSPPFGKSFLESLGSDHTLGRLDLLCALRNGSAEITYPASGPHLDVSAPEAALIFFFLRLLHRLQQLGTVPAMDLLRYGKVLEA